MTLPVHHGVKLTRNGPFQSLIRSPAPHSSAPIPAAESPGQGKGGKLTPEKYMELYTYGQPRFPSTSSVDHPHFLGLGFSLRWGLVNVVLT